MKIHKNVLNISMQDVNIAVNCLAFFIMGWAPLRVEDRFTFASATILSLFRYIYFLLPVLMCITMNTINLKRAELHIFVLCIIHFLFQRFWTLNIIANNNEGSLSVTFLCAAFCLQSSYTKAKVFEFIRKFMIITGLLGIICWISVAFNLGLPYSEVQFSRQAGTFYYDFQVSYLHHSINMNRICGLFNEPGWYGTFAAFYIISEKLNLKKKENMVVFISGILTFSVAYYVLLFIAFILFNLTHIRKWISVIIAVSAYFLALPNIKTGNPTIDIVIGRLIIVEGKLAGDNRTSEIFDAFFHDFLRSFDIFLGRGSDAVEASVSNTISIKGDLYKYGLFGISILYGLFFAIIYRYIKNDRTKVIFLICVFISQYQRLYLYETTTFFFLISFIFGTSYTSKLTR